MEVVHWLRIIPSPSVDNDFDNLWLLLVWFCFVVARYVYEISKN